MNDFLSGALMMCFIAISLFFTKFWISTKDKLFAMFAFSFLLLGFERLLLLEIDPAHESRSLVYIVRLIAFVFVIYAVIEKNRDGKKQIKAD